MRIELKIGDLRISAEDQAVHFRCPDLAVSAEQAGLIAKLLTLLAESLRTPSLPLASSTAAELPSAAQVVAAVAQAAIAPQHAAPRFAIRSPGVLPAASSATATRVPGRTASLTPSAPAPTTQAPVAPSAVAPSRRILGAAPIATAAIAAPAAVETMALEPIAEEPMATEAEAPPAVAQAPAAARTVVAPKSESSGGAAGELTYNGTAEQAAPALRRVLRPSTPAAASAEVVGPVAPAPAAKAEGASRRVLRPSGTPGAAAVAPASPPDRPAPPRRVVRPIAAPEEPQDVTVAEPALRRSVRPKGAQEVQVEAVQTGADSAIRRPGRPRQTPLNGQLSKDVAPALDETQPELPVRRKPGRPIGSRSRVTDETPPAKAPGRPRKSPQSSPVAEPAAQETSALAANAIEPSISESPAAAADTLAESKGRTMRLVDHLDQWMRENPGPKTREQLLDVAIANSWVAGPDSGRIFSMCMNREKNLFTRMPDGNTEIYLRRAELAPPNTPGKLIRRLGTGRPSV